MLFNKFVITIMLLITTISGSSVKPRQTQECCEEYCYDLDPSRPARPQYKNLGNRNSYYIAKGTDFQIYNMTGCQVEKIWTLVRHGTRYPSPESMLELKDLDNLRDEIIRLYNENTSLPARGKLCNADVELIRNWKWDSNITAQYDEFITISGWNEMRELAQDYKAVFPNLIGNSYSSEKFRFRHTDTQRTEASYKAFAEGLFGEEAYNGFTIEPLAKDNMLLNPHNHCDAYIENLAVQNGPDSELSKFRNTEMFRKLRNDVSARLGYAAPRYQPLSDKLVLNIYEMCRFEKAWFPNEPSPWCGTLTQSQMKILEYHEDLEWYMKTSYGSDINLKLGCATMNDMLNHLATNTSPNVIAYFGHIDNINPHFTAMGAFKDAIEFRSDNYEAMTNRKWRISEICPFGCNLAAVKYQCSNEDGEKEKVKFFLNQKILNLDWCDSSGVCKLSDVMERYSLFRNGDCRHIFCSTSTGVRLTNLLVLIFISTVGSTALASVF